MIIKNGPLTILETEVTDTRLLDFLAPEEPERPETVVHRSVNDGLTHLDRVRDDGIAGEPRHTVNI